MMKPPIDESLSLILTTSMAVPIDRSWKACLFCSIFQALMVRHLPVKPSAIGRFETTPGSGRVFARTNGSHDSRDIIHLKRSERVYY